MKFKTLGRLDYEQWLEVQEKYFEVVKSSKSDSGCVFLTEHEPVITLGKHANAKNLLDSRGFKVVRTDRGGDITAHMPGQIMVYPILNLRLLDLGPKKLVTMLEAAVIRVLEHWGIKGLKEKRYPGVWVGANKICAVGLRIKERVSTHGIAVNVCNQLDMYGSMIPCGIKNRGVTSFNCLLGEASPKIELVRKKLIDEITVEFDKIQIEGS